MAWGASSVQDAVAGVLFGGNMRLSECIIGSRVGRLEVVGLFKDGKEWRIECKCDCGSICRPLIGNVRIGKQVSCGCQRLEKSKLSKPRTHGQSNRKKPTSEYWTWGKMKQRCHNPNNPHYKDYGARGIFVCDRWRYSFENFFEDMGKKPTLLHSLDRINNNDGYYKQNCRWTTDEVQMGNRRCANRYQFMGELMSVEAINRRLGFKRGILRKRLKRGWSLDDAINTPISEMHSWCANHQFLKIK